MPPPPQNSNFFFFFFFTLCFSAKKGAIDLHVYHLWLKVGTFFFLLCLSANLFGVAPPLQPNPPPTSLPIESGGIYARSLVPHHLNPPILGKTIPPISGIGNHCCFFFNLNTLFPCLSLEIFPRQMPPKVPPFPRKWEHACSPLCIREGEGVGIPKHFAQYSTASHESKFMCRLVLFTAHIYNHCVN